MAITYSVRWCTLLLPTGFAGLMLACVLASVMNAGSVFVISTSALFTRNLMRVFRGDQRNEKRELLASRLFSIVLVAISILFALSFPDVPSAIRFMWVLIPLIGISFWLGLWWRRANRYGAWASFIAAVLAWLFGTRVMMWTGDRGLPYLISLYLIFGLVLRDGVRRLARKIDIVAPLTGSLNAVADRVHREDVGVLAVDERVGAGRRAGGEALSERRGAGVEARVNRVAERRHRSGHRIGGRDRGRRR